MAPQQAAVGQEASLGSRGEVAEGCGLAREASSVQRKVEIVVESGGEVLSPTAAAALFTSSASNSEQGMLQAAARSSSELTHRLSDQYDEEQGVEVATKLSGEEGPEADGFENRGAESSSPVRALQHAAAERAEEGVWGEGEPPKAAGCELIAAAGKVLAEPHAPKSNGGAESAPKERAARNCEKGLGRFKGKRQRKGRRQSGIESSQADLQDADLGGEGLEAATEVPSLHDGFHGPNISTGVKSNGSINERAEDRLDTEQPVTAAPSDAKRLAAAEPENQMGQPLVTDHSR